MALGEHTSHASGMNSVFHGLYAFDDRSVCELRVFDAAGNRVVIATEVEDNPGMSVVNAILALARDVERDFGEAPTTWISHYPGAESMASHWSEVVVDGPKPDWNRISREHAEEMVGAELPERCLDEHTMEAVARPSHPLLALKDDEPEREPLGSRLTIVPVAALPWPHNPADCPHHPRFEEISRCYPSGCWKSGAPGAHFFLTLTDRDFSSCGYHEPDWYRVAQASVEILEALPPEAELDDVGDAMSGRFSSELELEALHSLFSDPIIWTEEGSSITNGQHRTCALRASGAPLCVVETDGRQIDLNVAGDPRLRARAHLAAFWALQTFEAGGTENG
jgi:hypothetical protein